MKAEIIYVAELAAVMAKSEASVGMNLQLTAWLGAIPSPFRIGRRWAWHIIDVKAWTNAPPGT